LCISKMSSEPSGVQRNHTKNAIRMASPSWAAMSLQCFENRETTLTVRVRMSILLLMDFAI
jgi:hypothetical protein